MMSLGSWGALVYHLYKNIIPDVYSQFDGTQILRDI